MTFGPTVFRHIDHGYAVTSISSQCRTVGRVLVNADTQESDLLLNRRMAYVAVSRAKEDARIYTNSIEKLSAALDRQVDKEMGLEAMSQNLLQRTPKGEAVNVHRIQRGNEHKNGQGNGAAPNARPSQIRHDQGIEW